MLVDTLCQGPVENPGFPAFLDDLRQPRVVQVLTRYSLGSIWYQRCYGEQADGSPQESRWQPFRFPGIEGGPH